MYCIKLSCCRNVVCFYREFLNTVCLPKNSADYENPLCFHTVNTELRHASFFKFNSISANKTDLIELHIFRKQSFGVH